MPIDLDKPIAWTRADAEEQAMLSDLQGNILKGHGRHATLNLFLSLDGGQAKSRLLMRRLGALTTSALDQLHNADTHKRLQEAKLPLGATPTFYTVMLTYAGYEKLGLVAKAPGDGAFREGMRARASTLNDTENAVDPAWKGARPDVLVMIADDPDDEDSWGSSAVDRAEVKVLNIVTALGAKVLHKQAGRAIFRAQPDGHREGIEHFGYVDGRSQPLFLEESIATEPRAVWNPAFPLRQLLVSDPASMQQAGYGSYFVFRKLGQDVSGFKATEASLQKLKDQHGTPLGEVAGAMIVGRFEDGGQVTTFGEPLLDRIAAGTAGKSDPVPNDFDYSGDMDELRCPFHGHIRKTNPRGDTVRLGLAPDDSDERSRLMARRGITFGERDRVVDPSDNEARLAYRDVGLLFMAYQSDLAHQFEFTQQSWANNPKFASGFGGLRDAGRDPIIGQRGTNSAVSVLVRRPWDSPTAVTSSETLAEHVTFRGGDYFFAPARSTLLAM